MNRRLVGRLRRGTVSEFDDPAGYGKIVDAVDAVDAEAGLGPWFFHCSSIADGSRSIAVGTDVTFLLESGHLGRLEARDIRPA